MGDPLTSFDSRTLECRSTVVKFLVQHMPPNVPLRSVLCTRWLKKSRDAKTSCCTHVHCHRLVLSSSEAMFIGTDLSLIDA